ncbi:MAG: hypothetical protein ACOYOB_00370 [Myxococcota bacterium]
MTRLTAFRPHLLRRAHLRLLLAAVELAQRSLGEAGVLTAARRFLGRSFTRRQALEDYLHDHDAHSHFFPWLLWDAPLPDGPLGRRLIACHRRGPEREVLDALLSARADVYQVTGSDGDATLMTRVADGEVLRVIEPVLGAVAARGELFVARILAFPDCALLDAVHASLPAVGRRAMVRAARRIAVVDQEHHLAQLLAASRRALERIAEPTAPWREAGVLLRATLVFTVADSPVLEAALGSAVASGALAQRHGSRSYVIRQESFGPVGAVLRVAAGRLYAATGSAPRTRLLRSAVERHLPGLLYSFTVFRDLDALVDPALRQGWENDELQRVAQDWVGECLATFHDTPHPWLGGVTPREAVRTPAGRAAVQAWLQTVEQVTKVAGPGYHHELQSLWRDLAAT